jgi:hypothetical protein
MLLAARLAADGRVTELDCWAPDGCRCAIRTVRDAGFTEVAPGTVTVAAQWAAHS